MRIESLRMEGFRCFGADGVDVKLEPGLTTFIGCNGSGKTAVFGALSRLFGITQGERAVGRRDFHLSVDQPALESGAALALEAVFAFPETESDQDDDGAIPEFFSQMAVDGPGGVLRARMRLEATWTDDGTPEGHVDTEARWIQTLDGKYDWENCTPVASVERGAIQFIYVPASRDAARQVSALLKGRLWRAARWSDEFRDQSARSADEIQKKFLKEKPAKFVVSRLTDRWRQVHEADTDTTPILRLVERRFEELIRKAEFAFYPDVE